MRPCQENTLPLFLQHQTLTCHLQHSGNSPTSVTCPSSQPRAHLAALIRLQSLYRGMKKLCLFIHILLKRWRKVLFELSRTVILVFFFNITETRVICAKP